MIESDGQKIYTMAKNRLNIVGTKFRNAVFNQSWLPISTKGLLNLVDHIMITVQIGL